MESWVNLTSNLISNLHSRYVNRCIWGISLVAGIPDRDCRCNGTDANRSVPRNTVSGFSFDDVKWTIAVQGSRSPSHQPDSQISRRQTTNGYTGLFCKQHGNYLTSWPQWLKNTFLSFKLRKKKQYFSILYWSIKRHKGVKI